MNTNPIPLASTHTAHPSAKPPRTWDGLALYAGLVPLTLFALERPAVAAAAVTGVCFGLFARTLLRTLARRSDGRPSGSVGRPSDAVGRTATKD